ncbi:MAG: cyclic nucleotide-binding domain-containing protein, partial [candidate division Zixibacteria bacterium]|nr:cyclic nucleotide-binding domain-containing protein [candidate division Zixibacteria bacterium]
MLWLLAGSAAGGLIFVIFDRMLNAKGGYLRKAATAISYLSNRRKKQITQMLERLGDIEFIRSIPPEQVHSLIDFVRPVTFQPGEKLFDMGDVGDRLYFLEEGDIGLSENGEEFKTLHAGEVLGEIALVTGAPRTANAIAKTRTIAFELLKADFDRLRRLSPDLDAAIIRITNQRLEDLQDRRIETTQAAQHWASAAKNNIGHMGVPTQEEIHEAAKEHGGAPMSIWLGTVLDSIPESFVLGG